MLMTTNYYVLALRHADTASFRPQKKNVLRVDGPAK